MISRNALVACLIYGFAPVYSANNALIIDTSRQWCNYRHTTNVLSLYSVVKAMGIPDHRITLMVNGDVPCNARNADPGTVFHTRPNNLYTKVQIDYKGEEISSETISRVIKGKHVPHTPRNRRLLAAPEDNLFVFMTGHSGPGFAKIQADEEFYAADFGHMFKEMEQVGRYSNLFWVADTCKAGSLHSEFYSENFVAVGSSGEDESSYSRHGDRDLGVSVVDRFSYHAEDILTRSLINRSNLNLTIREFTRHFDRSMLMSGVSTRFETDKRGGGRILDFVSDSDGVQSANIVVGDWTVSPTEETHVVDATVVDFLANPDTKNIVYSPAGVDLSQGRWGGVSQFTLLAAVISVVLAVIYS